jgi:lysozyme
MKPVERERLQKALIAEEGMVLHAYQDHLGYWTIGCGHLIDKRKGGGITHVEALYLLNNDIDRAIASCLSRYSWYLEMTPARQAVLIQMTFQLGAPGLARFVNTLAAMKRGDYEAASRGMLASLWAKQTPARVKRLAAQMRSGEWATHGSS